MKRPSVGLNQTGVQERAHTHADFPNWLICPREVISLGAGATVAEAIELMQEKNIGALVITDTQKRAVGIFTEYDVLRRVATKIDDLSATQLAEVMTADPDTLPAGAPIAQALQLMNANNYRHVPITDASNVVVGIISFRDVVHYIEQYYGS